MQLERLKELSNKVEEVVHLSYKEGITPANYYEFLYLIVKEYKCNPIVEIGTDEGLSTLYMKEGNPEGTLYTIDVRDEGRQGSRITNVPNVVKYLGKDSSSVVDLVPNDIELLFIDGDHTYEGVKSDFNLYFPKVKSGGLVLFDDLHDEPGIRKFWEELDLPKWDFINIHVGYGFGGLIKV